MPRQQIQTKVAGPEVRVNDSLTRPYFNPVRAPSGAEQVARSLGQFSNTLRQVGSQVQEVKDQKTIEEAQKQAMEDAETLRAEQATFTEARADGTITAHEDPFFQLHYQEAIGSLLANRARSEWVNRREETLGDESSMEEYDAEFSQFDGEYQSSHFGELDEVAQAAYRETLEGIYHNDRTEYAYKSAGKLETQYLELRSLGMENEARTMIEGGASWEDIGTLLTVYQEETQATHGTNPAKRRAANDATFEAILSVSRWAAEEGMDPVEVFQGLTKNIRWGKGGAGDFTQGRYAEPYHKTLEDLRDTARDNTKRAIDDQGLEVQGLLDDGIRLVTDPGGMIGRVAMEALKRDIYEVGGPSAARAAATVEAVWEARNEARFNTTDDAVYAGLRAQVAGNPGAWAENRDSILQASSSLSDSDLTSLLVLNARFDPSKMDGSGSLEERVLADPFYKEAASAIPGYWGAQAAWKTDTQTRVWQARGMFTERYIQFLSENPEATDAQRREAAGLLQEEAVGAFLSDYDLQDFVAAPRAREPRQWRTSKLSDAPTLQAINALLPESLRLSAIPEATEPLTQGVIVQLLNEFLPSIGIQEGSLQNPDTMEMLHRFLRQQLDLKDRNGNPVYPSLHNKEE